MVPSGTKDGTETEDQRACTLIQVVSRQIYISVGGLPHSRPHTKLAAPIDCLRLSPPIHPTWRCLEWAEGSVLSWGRSISQCTGSRLTLGPISSDPPADLFQFVSFAECGRDAAENGRLMAMLRLLRVALRFGECVS